MPRPSQPLHIVLAGGGTAGHLFPGLAVAEVLVRTGAAARITVIGTGKSFERQHVAAAGYDYLALRCRPLPRKPHEALRFVTDNLSGYYTARRFLRAEGVSLVVGLGGYASAAAARAAGRLDIPYVLLEQNIEPGRATRWLAPQAARVCTAFSETRSRLRPGTRVRVTGTPIRREFASPRRSNSPEVRSRPRLIVLGGSGGSRTLNEQVPLAIYKAQSALAGWQVLHQTGMADAQRTAELYAKLAIPADVAQFFENLPSLLAESDLAVSRAGGTTLAEFAACGLPSILVPYPHATDDHQRRNAELFASQRAARLVDARDVRGRLDNALAEELRQLAAHGELRRRMGQRAAGLSRAGAAERVADLIVDVASRSAVAAA